MEARVGTLPVGTRFETLLTGRRGLVRANYESVVWAVFADRPGGEFSLHPDVRVRVLEVTH